MTGLFLLVVLGIWLAIVRWLVKLVSTRLPETWWRMPARVLLFMALLPLPVADEIVGKIQFEQLCKEKAVITIDAANTQGKTVWFGGSERAQIRLGTIEIMQARRNYVDAKTQEPFYHYYRLEATGGWLIRALRISEGNNPLLFRALCQPENLETIDAKLGLTRINRPTN